MADAFITLVSIQPSGTEQIEAGSDWDSLGTGQMKKGVFEKRRRQDVSPSRLGTGIAPFLPGPQLMAVGGALQNVVTLVPFSGAISYNVYWDTVSPTKGSNKLTGVPTSFVHTGRVSGQRCYYAAATVTSAGEGPLGSITSCVTQPVPASSAPMMAPIIVGTTGSGDGAAPAATVIWFPFDARALSHNVYWATTPGVTKLSNKISSVAGTSYQHTGLNYSSTYYYAVTSVGPSGESALSQEASASTGVQTPPMITGWCLKLDPDDVLSWPGSGTQWRDLSGNGYHINGVSSGLFVTATLPAIGKIFRITGGTNYNVSGLDLYNPFTVLVVSRYNGIAPDSRGRICTSNNVNWLLGAHGGLQKSRFYSQGWVTQAGVSDTNWHITIGTGQSGAYRCYGDGVDMTETPTGGTDGPRGLCLGGGTYSEWSNADIGALYAWKRVITPVEAAQAFASLRGKFGI